MGEHEKDITMNKNFQYTVTQDKIVKQDLPSGVHVTNCLRCNWTCHYNCAYSDDSDKQHCCAMSGGNCTVCDNKCHWTQHKNMRYSMVVSQETVTKTSEELRSKYESAKKKKLSHQELIEAQAEDV